MNYNNVRFDEGMMEKFKWQSHIRFIAGLVVLAAFGIFRLLNWIEFPFAIFSIAPLCEMFINKPYLCIARRMKNPQRILVANLIFDVLLITWGFHFAGGMNLFAAILVYPLTFIYVGIVWKPELTYLLANFSFICYATMVHLEYTGIWPLIPVGDVTMSDTHRAVTTLLVFPFYNIIAFFVSHLTKMLREREDRLNEAYVSLKKAQAQLIQVEKMELAGRLASGIAHEVQNPLANIMLGVNYLESGVSEQKHHKEDIKILHLIKNNVMRADNIVRALLDFSRITELKIEEEDINVILDSSIALLQHRIKLDDIEIIKKMQANLPKMLVDRGKMQQAFVNILLNAIQSMAQSTAASRKLFIRTYSEQLSKSSLAASLITETQLMGREYVIAIEIEDAGSGISKKDIDRIFDPFFTTKKREEGTGLGLSVTKNIIDMHRGIIEVKSKEGGGTKFTIFLKAFNDKKISS